MSTGLLKATSMPRSSTRKTYCCQGHHFQHGFTINYHCAVWLELWWTLSGGEKYLPFPRHVSGVTQWGAKELRSNLERLRHTPGPMTFASVTTSVDFKDGWMDCRSCNKVRRKKTMSPRRASRLHHRLLIKNRRSPAKWSFSSSCPFLGDQQWAPCLFAVLMQWQCLVLVLDQ